MRIPKACAKRRSILAWIAQGEERSEASLLIGMPLCWIIELQGVIYVNTVSPSKPGRGYEWLVVAILTLAFGFEFLSRLALSYLLPLIQPELGITNSHIGLLGFVNTGFYSLSAIIFGYVQDRVGGRKKWLVFWLSVTFVASGATAFVTSIDQLFIVRALIGIAEGPLFGLFGVVLLNLNPRNFGRNLGIANAGVGLLAVTLGPVLVTQMVLYLTWQMTYLIISLPVLVIALLAGLFIKEIKHSPEEAARQKQALVEAGGVFSLFKNKNIIICIFMSIMLFGGYWTIMLFAPLYMVNVTGLSVQQMGMVTSLSGILYIVYCIVVPKLSDNLGRKPAVIGATLAAFIAPLMMALFPATLISTIFYVIFGGVAGSIPPIPSVVIPQESLVENLRTTANGVISGVGEFVGGSCMPIVVGHIADTSGLRFTMGVGALMILLNVFLTMGLKETSPQALERRALREADKT
jgi:MFS family permease